MHTLKTCWFPNLTQSRLVPIQIHGQSELYWVSFWKKNACFQDNHFVCMSESRVVVMMCVCGCVVWRSLGLWRGVLDGGGGCVFGDVGGWVSEFWTSGVVYMLILTISMSTVCLTQFGQKVEWVILENKTKHSSFVSVIYKLTRKSNKQLERTNEQTNRETT